MDINIDALYNILKQNQGDVNDAMGSKKKSVMVTSDPLALIAKKTKVSKSKEIVVVSSDSEGSSSDDFSELKKITALLAKAFNQRKSKEKVVVFSDSKGSEVDDFSELKKITALLAKAFNRRKFYSKPTNNNLRTSSSSQSANKKQEFVKTDNKRVKKKDDEKKRDMSKMSRDVITVGSTMRIPLLYRGEYSQWRERFMNYLKEQIDGEAMIDSIQNGDQPLPVIAQVSLTKTAQNAPPTLKDQKFWTAEEKKTRKIDRLARYLLIQGLPNEIYSLIDSNETAKDLWDALERQMPGSEYGEQDRKAAILYEYDNFKATEGEQLLDTYLHYLQVINDLKKCGYKKDNYELNYKFLNNLQPEWKQYGTLMRQTKNLIDINIDALYNILKQNQGDVNDALGYKKKAVVVTSDPLALVAEKEKVSKRKEKVVVSSNSKGSGANDFSELKKITALLAKAFNRRKFYSKPTNNNLRTSSTSQSANKKQEFVKSDHKKVKKKDDEKKQDMSKIKCYNCKKEGNFPKTARKQRKSMQTWSSWLKFKRFFQIQTKVLYLLKKPLLRVAYYTSESESEFEFETSEYYGNSTNYGLFVNNDDDQEIFHDAIDSQKDYDKSEVDHNNSEEKEHLVDKLIRKFNHKIAKCQKCIKKANQQSKDLENQNKDL
nr:hypothetical protein [Tanacetum cinerariifolium]